MDEFHPITFLSITVGDMNSVMDSHSIAKRYRSAIIAIIGVSALMNGLVLSGSIYMMLVYDIVIPSHNAASLWGLLGILIVMYGFQAMMEFLRGRLMRRLAHAIGDGVEQQAYDLHIQASLSGEAFDPLSDLGRIRSYLSSAAPTAFLDMPWMLIFLTILYLFHPWLGLTAMAGAVVMILLAWRSERVVARETARAAPTSTAISTVTAWTRRHAEVATVLGMRNRMAARWSAVSRDHQTMQDDLASTAAAMGGATRSLRMLLQSVMLTVGALLVIDGKATGGVIFASSIMTSRALAPIDLAIANWRTFETARSSWKRLSDALRTHVARIDPLPLPDPVRSLAVEGVTVTPRDSDRRIVDDVTFRLDAGQAIAIIGSSASGKTSLLRAIVGAAPLASGAVRLDGAELEHWPAADLGRHIGYLPQDVQLIGQTIAQVVSRLDPEPDPKAIIHAASLAGIHEMIMRMPDGYATRIGTDGTSLSAGQRQRIGLARALYGDPFILVLDEPNSNLDLEGEQALTSAIERVRARGGIIVVAAHRQSVLKAVTHMLMMKDGKAVMWGLRDQIVDRLSAKPKDARTGEDS